MADRKGFGLIPPLILSVLISIALTVFVFKFSGDVEAIEELRAEADRKRVAMEEKINNWVRENQALRELIDGDPQNKKDPEMFKNNHMREAHTKLQNLLNDPDLRDQLAQGGAEVISRQAYNDFVSLTNDLLKEVDVIHVEYMRVRQSLKEKQALLEAEQSKGAELLRGLKEEISRIRAEKEREETARLADNRVKDEEIQRLKAELGRVRKDMEDFRGRANEMEARLESKINDLKARLAEQSEREKKTLATTQPDGEVIFSDNKQGIAFVNLGKKHGIRRGLTFEVITFIKGGRRKTKGQVEIQSVEEDMSKVAILRTDDGEDPIVSGDFVISPIFDKDEQQVFVIVGEISAAAGDRRELIRRLEVFGAKVGSEVTIETDFLVVGKGGEDSDETRRAVELGVVILREEELLEYLGR